MPSILLRRHLGSLKPVNRDAYEFIEKIKPGQIVRGDLKRVRNPRQHALYWAAINLCFEHQERYATRQQLHNAIKVAVGYYDEQPGPGGRTLTVPKSIAFGNMPQDEWEAFFDKFIKLICEKIIPNTDDAELRAELESMVGIAAPSSAGRAT